MAKKKRYIALDFGIHNGATMSGAFDGQKIELEAMRRFPVASTVMLGVCYWDFPAMIINAKRGLAAYAEKYGPDLAGLACDSWGVDFGLLDKTGHLLANPVHHLDLRTTETMDRLHSSIPARSVYQRTGIKPRREATLYQLHSMAAANSPLLDKAVTMLLMADLTSYFLSGIPVQEYTLATTTGMYDAETRDWSRDTILGARIPPVMMPEIVAPGTIIGPLLDSVARECGLGETPVIASGSHSMACAAAAVPASGDDWLYVVSGSWTQIGAELQAPIINDSSYLAGFSNGGGVDGTIRLLKDMPGMSVIESCRRTWKLEDGRGVTPEELSLMFNQTRPLKRFVDMNDARLHEAGDMPGRLNAILAENGQPAAETRAEFVRLVLDSIALSLRLAVEQINGITGRKHGRMHLVGRGAANADLCQAVADASGLPVMAGPVEAKALGNILMQAVALGDIGSLSQAREMVGASFDIARYEPTADRGAWDDAYGRFLKLK